MKRTMISLIITSIIFMPGCYDPGKNATVRINLGNMPVAKHVEKKTFLDKVFSLFVKDAYASYANDEFGITFIHIAALSGDTVIASISIDATSTDIVTNGTTDTVEFEVPAGTERNIVVLGEEGTPGLITWYGKTDRTYDFAAGDETNVDVQMNEITYTYISLHWSSDYYREEWSKILGATYNIYDPDGYYIGSTDKTYYPLTLETSYQWEAEFPFAGKKSQKISFFTS